MFATAIAKRFKSLNLIIYRCGVPYSCCIKNDEALVNLMCGFDVQRKSEADASEIIYTRGCLITMQVLLKTSSHVLG